MHVEFFSFGVFSCRNIKHGFVLIVFKGYYIHFLTTQSSECLPSSLTHMFDLLEEEVGVWDKMVFYIFDGWGLYLFETHTLLHFLSEFIETLEIKYTFGHGVDEVTSFEDVGSGGFFGDSFEVDISIEDNSAISIDVKGRFAFFWFDDTSQLY